MNNLIKITNELKTQFIDLQVAIYLDRMHEDYSDRMSFRVTDDAFDEVINVLQCNIQDRIRDIDGLIENLSEICSSNYVQLA